MNQPNDATKRAILEATIQQLENTAFQQNSLAKAYVEAGLTEEGKAQAGAASKNEMAALSLQRQLDAIPADQTPA